MRSWDFILEFNETPGYVYKHRPKNKIFKEVKMATKNDTENEVKEVAEKKATRKPAKKVAEKAGASEKKAPRKTTRKSAAKETEKVTTSTTVKSEKIRIRLKAYDHVVLEQSAEKIVDTAKKTGAKVSGPIPLPTDKEIVTILRSPHKHKDSREQFELRTHKRVIDILYPTQKTVDSLMKIELPAGVDIEIKL